MYVAAPTGMDTALLISAATSIIMPQPEWLARSLPWKCREKSKRLPNPLAPSSPRAEKYRSFANWATCWPQGPRRTCRLSAPACSRMRAMAFTSSTELYGESCPRVWSFASMPLISSCTTKSPPQASLMPLMVSTAKRVRFSSDCGPYSSSRLLRARDRNDCPTLFAAKLSSKASNPSSCSLTAMSTMVRSHDFTSSVEYDPRKFSVNTSGPMAEPMVSNW